MPRKAKDKVEKNEKINKKKTNSSAKKSTGNSKKETSAKKSTGSSPKETSVKKAVKKSNTTKTKKDAFEKVTSSTTKKKTASTKSTTITATVTAKSPAEKKKAVTSKSTKSTKSKISTKKATPTKTTRKRTINKSEKVVEKPTTSIIEYYDLPYKYGNTVVRLLAQTPKTLFVYWEVSDKDINSFKKIYGNDFFSKTKPILIVHNLTLNKITEIEINDFANCWYLNTEDSDCKYEIELARKYIVYPTNLTDESDISNINEQYLHIAASNNLQSPNNHILFEKIQEFVVFKNTENNQTIKKNTKSFRFLEDIYKFYKEMYDEDVLNNPSSQFKL